MKLEKIKNCTASNRLLFFCVRVALILYLAIFGLSYMTSDTSASFSKQVGWSETIAIGEWADEPEEEPDEEENADLEDDIEEEEHMAPDESVPATESEETEVGEGTTGTGQKQQQTESDSAGKEDLVKPEGTPKKQPEEKTPPGQEQKKDPSAAEQQSPASDQEAKKDEQPQENTTKAEGNPDESEEGNEMGK